MRGEKHGWIRRVPILLLLAATANAQRPPEPAQPQITGRVVDETGKPIAGAAVGAFADLDFVDTGKLLAKPQAVTAADGTYAITASDGQRNGVLVLAVAGRQSCALQITDAMVDDGDAVGDTLLVPGAKLIGRVRDEAGAPLAGVRIRVESSIVDHFTYQVRIVAGAVSDDKGIFVVPCVPPNGLRLCAEADGYLAESRLVAIESPIDLSLRTVGMVRGKVVDAEGTPLAGIEVHGITMETRDACQPAVSAADGSFAITVPKRGRFRVAGSERKVPYRQFSSGLLHGPADKVVVAWWNGVAGNARRIEVVVVDAASQAPVPQFRLSQQYGDPSNLFMAIYQHYRQRRAFDGKASPEPLPGQAYIGFGNGPGAVAGGKPLLVVVDAPGHGFEVVPVPDDLDKTMVVALGPEAVLTGRVTDTETGKPMAGVPVRTLPWNPTLVGGGGRIEDGWPRSDAQGIFCVTGLRPGQYTVQAHAAGRPASALGRATLAAGAANKLDLAVPKQQWLEFELVGTVPSGPAARLSVSPDPSASHGVGYFAHSSPQAGPLSITRAGKFRLGPVGESRYLLHLFVPSRTRVGTGTTIELGDVAPDRGRVAITLPELKTRIVQGRVEFPTGVPSERLALLATAVLGPRSLSWLTDRPNVAGIDADGRFAIDLPTGSYHLQLVDLLTSVVFHTETDDLEVDEHTSAIILQPQIHWLEVECSPQHTGDEVLVQSIGVTLPRPRNGACSAFLQSWSRSGEVESGSVEFRLGAEKQRWLVPAGQIEIRALQNFQILHPWAQDYRGTEVDSASLDIDKPEQRVTLTIPPPPSDEELLRRQ